MKPVKTSNKQFYSQLVTTISKYFFLHALTLLQMEKCFRGYVSLSLVCCCIFAPT